MKANLLTEENEEEEEELGSIPLSLAHGDGIEYMIPSQVNAQMIEVAPSQEASVDLLATAVNLSNDTNIKGIDRKIEFCKLDLPFIWSFKRFIKISQVNNSC